MVDTARVKMGETARMMVFGPNWKMLASIAGGIILSMISLFTLLGLSEMGDQRFKNREQDEKISRHDTDIVRLQSDVSYIKLGVDEIRSIIRNQK